MTMQEAQQLKKFFQSKNPTLLALGENNQQREAFLNQANTHTTPDQMVLRLKGKTTCKPENLTAIFNKHWAVSISSNEIKLNAQLDEILACLKENKQTCVLLVDHANLLPISVLAALCHLSHKQENQFITIRIILAGKETLSSKINALYLKKFAFPPVINLKNLPPSKKNKSRKSSKQNILVRHQVKMMATIGIFAFGFVLWHIENSHFTKSHLTVAHAKRQATHG